MAKYLTIVLLIAVSWSSASAKPHHHKFTVEDEFFDWALPKVQSSIEPFKTDLSNSLLEVKGKHWDNFGEFAIYALSAVNENYEQIPETIRQSTQSGDQETIKTIIRWSLLKAQDEPEPYKTKLINLLHEASDKQWDNLNKFTLHALPALQKIYQETEEVDRKKRFYIDDSELSKEQLLEPIEITNYDNKYNEKSSNTREFKKLYDSFRRRRDVDSDSEESSEKQVEKFLNGKEMYELYAEILVAIAPEAYKSSLENRFTNVLENKKYSSFEEFQMESVKIFEEVTGLNFTEYVNEIEKDSDEDEE